MAQTYSRTSVCLGICLQFVKLSSHCDSSPKCLQTQTSAGFHLCSVAGLWQSSASPPKQKDKLEFPEIFIKQKDCTKGSRIRNQTLNEIICMLQCRNKLKTRVKTQISVKPLSCLSRRIHTVLVRNKNALVWCETYLVSEEELPYWHLKHEVVLAETEADVCYSTVEEAGGSEHQDQVEVPREGGLDEEDSHFYITDICSGPTTLCWCVHTGWNILETAHSYVHWKRSK